MLDHNHISVTRDTVLEAIAVSSVAENSFSSESLWTPHGHPGVYGGQLVAQAVHSAAKSVHVAFDLNVCPFSLWQGQVANIQKSFHVG